MNPLKSIARPFWRKCLLPFGELIVNTEQRRRARGFHDWESSHRPRLKRYKNKHQGEDCFIIGNGPSLNKMDLSRLNAHHTFGLNKIFLIFDRVKLQLSYHVAVNPLVIQQCLDEFQKLNCPSFLSYPNCPQPIPKREDLEFLFTRGVPLCFPGTIDERVSEGWTVTYVALQVAYYMGFKRVFLIGVDHSFAFDGKPNERQVLRGDDLNHFVPDYFAGKEWDLPDLEGSEMAYRLARFSFERAGREIFDATVDGQLTVFPKLSFDAALELCCPRISGQSN